MIAILVDTNVLVYAHDQSERPKQRQAIDVLSQIVAAGSGALSTQTLSEFYNVATHKLSPPLTPTQTETQLRHFVDLWPVFDVTPPVVLEAARGVREHSLSFWDAQIWAVAWLNGLSIVLSEDIDAGAEVEGVRFVNPFAAGFRPEDWGL